MVVASQHKMYISDNKELQRKILKLKKISNRSGIADLEYTNFIISRINKSLLKSV